VPRVGKKKARSLSPKLLFSGGFNMMKHENKQGMYAIKRARRTEYYCEGYWVGWSESGKVASLKQRH
jgi:hypothetical protein